MATTESSALAHPSTPERKESRADRALALYVEAFDEIAASFRAGVYKVPSASGRAPYTVRLVPETFCSCPDFHGGECKHVLCVRVVRKRTAPCVSCGRRFRFRDLVEVPEDHEMFFAGDKLCRSECARRHSVL